MKNILSLILFSVLAFTSCSPNYNAKVNINATESLPKEVAISYLKTISFRYGISNNETGFTDDGVKLKKMGAFNKDPIAERPYSDLNSYYFESMPTGDIYIRFYDNSDTKLFCPALIDSYKTANKIATALESLGIMQAK